MKTPYCKLSKLKKSQSSSSQLPVSSSNNGNSSGGSGKTSNNHTPVKQRAAAEQQSGLHSAASPRSPLESGASLPCVQSNSGSNGSSAGSSSNNGGCGSAGGYANSGASGSPVKSPGSQPKRKRLKAERSLLKDREYDPDRHCGVWNEETGKPCTRSLTCKAHTVSLRRTVVGRSKSFDKLLADHRAAKEPASSRASTSGAGPAQPQPPPPPPKLVAGVSGSAAAELATASALAPSTPAAATPAPELEAPSSPPVLSLPDTYPLPQVIAYCVRSWIFDFPWWPLSL